MYYCVACCTAATDVLRCMDSCKMCWVCEQLVWAQVAANDRLVPRWSEGSLSESTQGNSPLVLAAVIQTALRPSGADAQHVASQMEHTLIRDGESQLSIVSCLCRVCIACRWHNNVCLIASLYVYSCSASSLQQWMSALCTRYLHGLWWLQCDGSCVCPGLKEALEAKDIQIAQAQQNHRASLEVLHLSEHSSCG